MNGHSFRETESRRKYILPISFVTTSHTNEMILTLVKLVDEPQLDVLILFDKTFFMYSVEAILTLINLVPIQEPVSLRYTQKSNTVIQEIIKLLGEDTYPLSDNRKHEASTKLIPFHRNGIN